MHPDTKHCHTFARLPLRIVATLIAGLVLTAAASAQQAAPSNASDNNSPNFTLKRGHIRYSAPHSGKQMYAQHCAVCHGNEGRGNGPAAPALTVKPTDLTILTAQNRGVFPRDRVRLVLTNAENRHSSGTTDMPAWCPAFRTLDSDFPGVVTLRVHNLVSYLETLQVPNPNAVPAVILGDDPR